MQASETGVCLVPALLEGVLMAEAAADSVSKFIKFLLEYFLLEIMSSGRLVSFCFRAHAGGSNSGGLLVRIIGSHFCIDDGFCCN